MACTGGNDTGAGDWTGCGAARRTGPSKERRLPGFIEVIAHKYNQYHAPLTSTNTYRTPPENPPSSKLVPESSRPYTHY